MFKKLIATEMMSFLKIQKHPKNDEKLQVHLKTLKIEIFAPARLYLTQMITI